MPAKFLSPLVAGAICASGGGLFYLAGLPLPWMLGSLSAAAVTAVCGGRWFLPASLRSAARPVVGVLVGGTFTAEVMSEIPGWWDAILIVFAQAIAVTLLGLVYFQKIGGFDRQTAFFAALPGGVSEVALLGASMGGHVRSIVLSHLMRTLIVILTMPFVAQLVVGHPIGRILPTSPVNDPPTLFDWSLLAICAVVGFGLARAVKFAPGLMIFPMLLSAAVHGAGLTQASPPSWLIALVQVVVGGIIGARFSGISWREMRRTLVCGVGWALALLAIAAACAEAGGWLVGRAFLAMMLALAPGGSVEMTILTFSVGFEVAFVVTCQVCRILVVLLAAPALARIVVPVAGSGDHICDRRR